MEGLANLLDVFLFCFGFATLRRQSYTARPKKTSIPDLMEPDDSSDLTGLARLLGLDWIFETTPQS